MVASIKARACYILALLALIVPVLPAASAETETVFFAGIAFTENFSEIENSLPYTASIMNDGGNKVLSELVRKSFTTSPPQYLNIVYDQLGRVDDSNRSIAFALAIDRETVSVEKIAGKYKLLTEIAVQGLFFDYKTNLILGGYPIILQTIDLFESEPSDVEIQNKLSGLLLGLDAQSLVPNFVNLLQNVELPKPSARSLRVVSVSIKDEALNFMPKEIGERPLVIEARVAQSFGRYLAKNQNIALLPYSSNQALGSGMAARFANGDVFQLVIPEPDYEIALSLDGFKKIEHTKNAAATTFVYGAFVHVNVREPLSQKHYFDHQLKYGAPKIVPVSQESVDDWAAAYETLLLLFDAFTSNIHKADRKWANTYIGDSGAVQDLKQLTQLIEMCK